MAEKYYCDLCGLPIEVEGFTIPTPGGLKRFCCEGCEGVFNMLHGDASGQAIPAAHKAGERYDTAGGVSV